MLRPKSMLLPRLLKPWLYRVGLTTAPGLLFRVQHLRMHRRFGTHWYWANLRNPRTFNERLLRSKLDAEHAHLSHLVDKALVKDWVAARIGRDHIVPTLGIYEEADQVPLASLPRPCILKPTHASGHVIILRGDDEPPAHQIVCEMSQWLRINHYHITGEPQYRGIQPRIICEPLLGDGLGDLPDYKILSFHGTPTCIQVDLDRRTFHVRRFYDSHWHPLDFAVRYPKADRDITRPVHFGQMLEIARVLAADFAFVRVDLYCVDKHVYFGELTFHPGSGNEPFSDHATDRALGDLLMISQGGV